MDINKFQLKRVNPFHGLVIDADTWQDAHNYHRDQQRLHVLAFHDTGIVSGMEVSANDPPDLSVNISPGIAIDPDGNVVIVPQKQHYKFQTNEKGPIYLIIQFREIPVEPFQPPVEGQPTRILEAYRIQERAHLPAESYLELGRIDFNPAQTTIKTAANAARPVVNEIDLRNRKNARQVVVTEKTIPVTAPPQPTRAEVESTPKETFIVGHLALGEAQSNLHLIGLKNVIKELNRRVDYNLVVEEKVNLARSLSKFSLIYLTGNNRFDLPPEQQTALNNFVQSGGILFGDGCSRAASGNEAKGAREFGLAFNRLASKANTKLEIVKSGHPLLKADYVFSDVPPGCDPPMLLEGGNIICSNSDYGCAWEGDRQDPALSRDVIRSAIEIGCNIMYYGLRKKTSRT